MGTRYHCYETVWGHKINKIIKAYQKEGWHLHSHTAAHYFLLLVKHYLIFKKDEKDIESSE